MAQIYKPDDILYTIPYKLRPFTGGSILYRRPVSMYVPQQQQQQDREVTVLDYNDPTELNSVADLILNQAARDKHIPVPEELSGVAKYVAQTIIGLPILTYRATIKPIITAAKQEEGINKLNGGANAVRNLLINFSETMDVLGNVVKGAALEEEGAAIGIRRALGIGDEGRYNYDWDTGNFLSDIALEVVSDPMVWATVGASLAGSAAVSTGRQAMTTVLRKVVPDVSDDALYVAGRVLGNNLIRTGNLADAAQATARVLGRTGITHRAIPELAQALTDPKIVNALGRALSNSARFDVAQHVMNFASRTWRGTDLFERTLARTVGWTSGVTPVFRGIKGIGKQVSKLIQNRTAAHMKAGFINKDQIIALDRMEEFEAALHEAVDPIVDAGHAPEDTYHRVRRALQLHSAKTEMIRVSEMLTLRKSPDELLKELNKYYMEESLHRRTFFEVYEKLEEIATQYPEYEPYYSVLHAAKNYVALGLSDKATDQILNTLTQSFKFISDGSKVLSDMMVAFRRSGYTSFEGTMPAEQVARMVSTMLDAVNNLHDFLAQAQSIPEYRKYLVKLLNTNFDEQWLGSMMQELEALQNMLTAATNKDYTLMQEFWQQIQANNIVPQRTNTAVYDVYLQPLDDAITKFTDLAGSHNGELYLKSIAESGELKDMVGQMIASMQYARNSVRRMDMSLTPSQINNIQGAIDERIRILEIILAAPEYKPNEVWMYRFVYKPMRELKNAKFFNDAVLKQFTHARIVRMEAYDLFDEISKLYDMRKADAAAAKTSKLDTYRDEYTNIFGTIEDGLNNPRAAASAEYLSSTAKYSNNDAIVNISDTELYDELRSLRVMVDYLNNADFLQELWESELFSSMDFDELFTLLEPASGKEVNLSALKETLGILDRNLTAAIDEELTQIHKTTLKSAGFYEKRWKPFRAEDRREVRVLLEMLENAEAPDVLQIRVPYTDPGTGKKATQTLFFYKGEADTARKLIAQQQNDVGYIEILVDNPRNVFEVSQQDGSIESLRALSNHVAKVLSDIDAFAKEQDISLAAAADLPSITRNAKLYTMQNSKAAEALLMKSVFDERFGLDTSREMLSTAPGSLGALLRDYASHEDYTGEVMHLLNFANSNVAEHIFYAMLEGNPVTKDIFRNMFDVMQTFQTLPLHRVIGKGSEIYGKLKDALERQLTAIGRKAGLDTLFSDAPGMFGTKEGMDDIQSFLNEIKETKYTAEDLVHRGHIGGVDVLRLMYVVERHLTTAAPDSTTLRVYYDVEATGSNVGHDLVYQISAATVEGGRRETINIRLPQGAAPDEALIQKLFRDDAGNELDIEGAIKRWHEFRNSAEYTDDAEGIQQFLTTLRKWADETGKDVELWGWNNARYDDLIMEHNLRHNKNVPTFRAKEFRAIPKRDGLLAWYNSKGVPHVTEEQWGVIKSALEVAIQFRNQFVAEFGANTQLFITPNNALTRSLSQVAQGIRETKIVDEWSGSHLHGLLSFLNEKAASIAEGIDALSHLRRSLGDTRFIVNTETGEFFDGFGNALDLQKIDVFKNELPQHTSHLFVNEQNQLTQVAVRRLVDTVLLKTVFPYEKYLGLPVAQQEVLTSFAKSYNSIASSIAQYDVLIAGYDKFPAAAETIMEFIKAYGSEFPPLWVPLLNLSPTSPIHRFVTTYKLFKHAEVIAEDAQSLSVQEAFKAMRTRLSKTLESQEIMQGLDHVIRMYSGLPFTLHVAPFSTGFFTVTDVERVVNARKFYDLIPQYYSELVEKGRAMDDLLEQAGIANRTAAAHASIIHEAVDALDTMSERIRKLAEATGGEYEANRIRIETQIYQEYRNLMYAEHILLGTKAEDMPYFLFGLSGGHITYSAADAQDHIHQAIAEDLLDMILARKEELAKHGVVVTYQEPLQRVTLSLSNDKEMIDRIHNWDLAERRAALEESKKTGMPMRDIYAKYRTPFKVHDIHGYNGGELPTILRDCFNKLEKLLTEVTHGKNLGTLNEMFDFQDAMGIYYSLPASVRQNLFNPELLQESNRFAGAVFNRSNLGTLNGKREIMETLSSNPVKTVYYAFTNMSSMLDARTKYVRMMESPDHQLYTLGQQGFTVPQVQQYLKDHPDEQIMVLYNNAKGDARVSVNGSPTAEQLALYISDPNIHASILPSYIIHDAYKHVNEGIFSNKAIKALNEYVIGPIKLGYLMTPGWPFRNLIDTTGKTIELILNSLGPSSAPFKISDFTKAYLGYKRIYRDVVMYYDDAIRKSDTFSIRKADRYFELHPDLPISKELFMEMYTVSQQAGSAGLSKVERERMLRTRKSFEAKYGTEKKGIGRKILEALTDNKLVNTVFDVNEDIELVLRMYSYFVGSSIGLTKSGANALTLSRHFDYAYQPPALQILEEVMPFSTYTVYNLIYWMDMLESSGIFMGLAADVMRPIANQDEYDPEELQFNASLQYHVLAGNIILPNNGVLKINSSMLDALRTIMSPREVLNRFADYIQVVPEMLIHLIQDDEEYDYLKKILTSLPLAGPVVMRHWDTINGAFKVFGDVVRQRYVSYETHGTVSRMDQDEVASRLMALALPSVFGAVLLWQEYDSVNRAVRGKRVPKTYIPKPYMPRPRTRRARRTWHRRSWGKRAYHRNTYAWKLFPDNRARIIYRNHSRQMRMPGGMRNLAHTAPGVYKRIYTGSGRSRFQARLLPVTSQNLASRLRSDWSSIR